MLTIAHISDIHLGRKQFYRVAKNGHNQRELDICAAFDEAITRAIEIAPDIVLITGDLFDAVRPTNYIIKFCYRQLKRAATTLKAPIVIIAGNHEAPKRAETGSVLKLLEEIDNVFVADSGVQQFNFDGKAFKDKSCSITCIPYQTLYERLKEEEASNPTDATDAEDATDAAEKGRDLVKYDSTSISDIGHDLSKICDEPCLKGKKNLAQGNALGKVTTEVEPCKGDINIKESQKRSVIESAFKDILPNRKYKFNILATHCMVAGSKFSGFVSNPFRLSKLNPEVWDYVALGDAHDFERLAFNTAYAGALEHVSSNFWSEETHNRGFLKISFPGPDIVRIKLSTPRAVVDLGEILVKEKVAAIENTFITAKIEPVVFGV